jgi:hypothetical protein
MVVLFGDRTLDDVAGDTGGENDFHDGISQLWLLFQDLLFGWAFRYGDVGGDGFVTVVLVLDGGCEEGGMGDRLLRVLRRDCGKTLGEVGGV